MQLRRLDCDGFDKDDADWVYCCRWVELDRGWILSIITWFSLSRVSRCCQILSIDGDCLSLATFVVPTPVKTILELFRPAFRVFPKTGDAEPVDRGKPG